MFWINWFKSKQNIPCVQHLPDHVSTLPHPNEGKNRYKSCSKGTQRMAAPCQVALLFKLTTQAMATATYMVNSSMMVADGPADISALKKALCVFLACAFCWQKTLDVKNLFPNVASQRYISYISKLD